MRPQLKKFMEAIGKDAIAIIPAAHEQTPPGQHEDGQAGPEMALHHCRVARCAAAEQAALLDQPAG